MCRPASGTLFSYSTSRCASRGLVMGALLLRPNPYCPRSSRSVNMSRCKNSEPGQSIQEKGPSVEAQNMLLSEAARVLRPGGTFAGTDSPDGQAFRDSISAMSACQSIPSDSRLASCEQGSPKLKSNPTSTACPFEPPSPVSLSIYWQSEQTPSTAK